MTTTTVSTTSTKTSLEVEAEQMSTNLIGVAPANAKIAVGSEALNPAQATTELDAGLKAIAGAGTAKTSYAEAVATKKAAIPRLRQVIGAVAMYLKATITDSAELASCGIHPAKPKAQLNTAQKTAKAAKATATRKANGTRGKRQKRAAELAASAKTVVLGPNGQPLDGAALPAAATIPAPAVTPAGTGSK